MIVLAPYRWLTDGPVGPHWAGHGPGVDLRRRSEMAAPGGVTGYGIFEVADDASIDGAVTFTGNAIRDRDAWESTLGVRPSGSTPEEMLWDHLTEKGDDTGADGARPLRAINADDFELHFGGRKTRKLTNAQKLQQAVSVRRDLDAILDAVEAGKLPPGTHRRALAMYARKLGVDPRTLKSKAARWRNEDAEEPHTLLCSTFQDLARFDDLNSPTWTLSGGTASIQTIGVNGYLRHKGAMSGSDHEAQLQNATYNATGGSAAVMVRVSADGTDATIDGYWMGTYQSDLFIFSVINGTYSLLFGDASQVSAAHPVRGDCSGSTIRGSVSLSTWTRTITNTSITSGVKVCALQYRHNSSSGRTISGFRAFDGGSLSPTVTGVSPSTGTTAGGTAIELTGTNFDIGGTVNLGGGSATSVVIFDDTKATAVTPAGTGTVDVGMTTGGGTYYGARVNGFTYTAAVRNRRMRLVNAFLEG